MSITLSPEQEAEIAAFVAGGRYPSGEAVLVAAFAALAERERREAKQAAHDPIIVVTKSEPS